MELNNLLNLPSEQFVIVYGVLFVGVMLLVESLLQLVLSKGSGSQDRINRRLRMLDSGIDPQEVLQRLRRKHIDEKKKGFHPLNHLEWMIIRAGWSISLQRFVIIMVAVALVTVALVRITDIVGLVPSILIGAVCGIAFPLLYLRSAIKRRLLKFAEQLPEAIDLLVRSLKAGHPLNAGLGMVAEELPDPIGSEFGLAVDETTYGADLRDSIGNMGERIDLPDLDYLTIAIRIQYGTGGNLAEILENLSRLIRSRFNMFRKVKAITAEGRLSAWFLSLFPIVLGGVLISIKPDYYQPITESDLFVYIATITCLLLIINVVIMRWMVNIKF